MTPLFIVFYRLRALGPVWQLLLVAVLGTWALVVNGTFFAAMSLRTRSREIMLPLLLFPISIPAILAMVQATTAILNGEGARFWIVLLATYDLVFTTVCLLLFETVLNAEWYVERRASRPSGSSAAGRGRAALHRQLQEEMALAE